ncbi:hypothetical protein P0Y35_10715 [Kiritimatiellaeota bacterium B1221]|nr:hypothetical protein [Kiritimatiellaeota bacterium B1221]
MYIPFPILDPRNGFLCIEKLVFGVLFLASCSKTQSIQPTDLDAEPSLNSTAVSQPSLSSANGLTVKEPELQKKETPKLKKPIEEYINDLASNNAAVRIDAMGALEQAGVAAVPNLIEFAKGATGAPRVGAFFVLGDVATSEHLEQLESFLNDKENPLDSRAKAVLFGTMAKVGGEQYLDLFKEEIKLATNEDVQTSLAVALTEMGDNSGTGVFLLFLETKQGRATIFASKWLQKIYGKDLGTDPDVWRNWLKKNGITFTPIKYPSP